MVGFIVVTETGSCPDGATFVSLKERKDRYCVEHAVEDKENNRKRDFWHTCQWASLCDALWQIGNFTWKRLIADGF